HCPLSTTHCLTAPATPVSYTLSLHDALPISRSRRQREQVERADRAERLEHERQRKAHAVRARTDVKPVQRQAPVPRRDGRQVARDRKSTRLNSSHVSISYAVFCLKKKKNETT